MTSGESWAETATRASIFLKLKQSDSAPRELAWKQFYEHYAPVISSYAYRKGATKQQADEVVQDVICGFFEASPRFVYDPSRGRFRGYLMTCVARALSRKNAARSRGSTVSVDQVEISDDRDEELWEKLWQQQMLRRAMAIVREQYLHKGKLHTFLAFEQNVVLGVSAPDTAKQLGVNVASVHAAKTRVTEKLREVRAMLHDEEG